MTTSYNYLTDSELLRVAETSDSELVRELAIRFDRMIETHEQMLDAYDLREDSVVDEEHMA